MLYCQIKYCLQYFFDQNQFLVDFLQKFNYIYHNYSLYYSAYFKDKMNMEFLQQFFDFDNIGYFCHDHIDIHSNHDYQLNCFTFLINYLNIKK